jgi:hypothetical protein
MACRLRQQSMAQLLDIDRVNPSACRFAAPPVTIAISNPIKFSLTIAGAAFGVPEYARRGL